MRSMRSMVQAPVQPLPHRQLKIRVSLPLQHGAVVLPSHTNQGNNMRDTVELLEAIGRDATLRHASREELAKVLLAANASAGLRELASGGDSTTLTKELGLEHMHVEHTSQTGGHEGDGHDDHHHHHPDHDHDHGKDDKPAQRPDDGADTPPA